MHRVRQRLPHTILRPLRPPRRRMLSLSHWHVFDHSGKHVPGLHRGGDGERGTHDLFAVRPRDLHRVQPLRGVSRVSRWKVFADGSGDVMLLVRGGVLCLGRQEHLLRLPAWELLCQGAGSLHALRRGLHLGTSGPVVRPLRGGLLHPDCWRYALSHMSGGHLLGRQQGELLRKLLGRVGLPVRSQSVHSMRSWEVLLEPGPGDVCELPRGLLPRAVKRLPLQDGQPSTAAPHRSITSSLAAAFSVLPAYGAILSVLSELTPQLTYALHALLCFAAFFAFCTLCHRQR